MNYLSCLAEIRGNFTYLSEGVSKNKRCCILRRNTVTTVQCSICSQLNNKHRVVVTDFRLHHTCSLIILWLHSLSGVIRSLRRLCLHIRPNYIHSASNDIHTDGPRATARARASAKARG